MANITCYHAWLSGQDMHYSTQLTGKMFFFWFKFSTESHGEINLQSQTPLHRAITE